MAKPVAREPLRRNSRANRARSRRWGEVPGLELYHTEAMAYLQGAREQFDAAYSVYGAVWFTAPDLTQATVLAAPPGRRTVGTLIVSARA